MDKFDRGPMSPYEITWADGHTETFRAHQLSWAGRAGMLTSEGAALFHSEIDGRWGLVLAIDPGEFHSIRRVDEPALDPDAELIELMSQAAFVSAHQGTLRWEDQPEFNREQRRKQARAALAVVRKHEAAQA